MHLRDARPVTGALNAGVDDSADLPVFQVGNLLPQQVSKLCQILRITASEKPAAFFQVPFVDEVPHDALGIRVLQEC